MVLDLCVVRNTELREHTQPMLVDPGREAAPSRAADRAQFHAVVVCDARLLLLKPGKQQRILAGLGQFGEVLFHAGLDMAAARLNAGAFLLRVRLTGLRYRHITDQRRLAGRRELAEMFLDARFEPAVARLNLGT